MTLATLLNSFLLGWSVAWPPGPINAEMIRRVLLPRAQGGGFWPAWQLGLGACTGDFMWALGVAAGAGALLASPRLHLALGIISFLLLLFLAFNFARGAWQAARANGGGASVPRSDRGAKAAPTLVLHPEKNFAFAPAFARADDRFAELA